MALEFSSKKWFASIISIIILTDLAILLNIPFVRQIIGFFFLTIVPGLLIIQILKLNKTEFVEKFVLLVGLSISFLMFFGLLLNNSLLSIGYETPLATIPLLIAFNLAFTVLAIMAYEANKTMIFSVPNLKLNRSEKVFLIIPVLFPALSMFGMNLMNATSNNVILLVLLFLIPIYVISVCFFNQKFPKRIYPIVIFLISISLLLLLSLRSNHIIGIDTHKEYYFFQTTLNNLHWNVFGHSALDACLSISLLPTIYQSILNVSPESLFKIMYSLLYSISPLVVYFLSKKYVGEFHGFLASCFFMFQTNFLFTAYNARTNMAVLFFALAMMVFFNDRINQLEKKALFIVFMASCIVSHYSTTYIFLFILFSAFVAIELVPKKYTVKKVISAKIIIIFFVLIFFWYSQVTETAFNAGVGFIENTLSNLNRFFVEESRGYSTQTLLGKGVMQLELPYIIQFVFSWLMFAFIGIGTIALIRSYKEMSFSGLNLKKPEFLKEKFEVTYFMIALTCVGLLSGMVAVPFISVGYNLDRLYAVVITILSVLFVIGGITLSKYTKVRAYFLVLLVLIPYFFCCTGVMYDLLGVPRAIILNSEGEQYDMLYVHDQESYGARWWGDHVAKYYQMTVATEYQKIHSDFYGYNRLISQGKIKPALISCYWLSRYDEGERDVKGYFYLRNQNVVNGKLMNPHGKVYNMTNYQDLFIEKNVIYDSGCSRILR